MPIVPTIPHVAITATPGQTIFPFTWPITDASDLEVYYGRILAVLNVHYSVTGVGSPSGGNVIFNTPAFGGEVLTLRSQIPLRQNVAYTEHGPFPALAHEGALDWLTRLTQQLQEQLNRTPRLHPSTLLGAVELPDPASLMATQGGRKVIAWDGAETNLALVELVTQTGLVGDVVPSILFSALPPAGTQGRLRYLYDADQFAIDDGAAWVLFTAGNELIMPITTRALLGSPAGANAGKMRYLSDIPLAITVSDGTVWRELPIDGIGILAASAFGSLPAATPAGQMRRVTDSTRGMALSNGSDWVHVNAPTYRPEDYAGVGLAAKLNACLAAMPAAGGTIDCRSFDGAQTWDATVTITKPVCLLLAPGTLTATVATMILTTGNGRLSLRGSGVWGTNIVTALTAPELIKHTANAALECQDLLFQTSALQVAGAAITINPTTYANMHSIRRCGIDGYYRGLLIGNANGILIDHCGITNCRYAGVETSYIAAAPDSGQLKITNCDLVSSDLTSAGAAIISLNASGLYVSNCTILGYAYGALVQCSVTDTFNEFMFYDNRIAHQLSYCLVFQRLAGAGTLNGVEISDNIFGGSTPGFVACIGLVNSETTYCNRVNIKGNAFTLNGLGDMGCELAGGATVVLSDNTFVAGHPGAIAVSIGTFPTVYFTANTYVAFTQNASITYRPEGNVRYFPVIRHMPITIDVPSIAAGGFGSVDITILGLSVAHGDTVLLRPPAALAIGLVYLSCFVVADDTLRIVLTNTTGAPINDSPRVWHATVFDVVL